MGQLDDDYSSTFLLATIIDLKIIAGVHCNGLPICSYKDYKNLPV